MNAPVAATLFGAVELAPRDPILGVSEAFVADANPNKVNLGVGVYCDDNGKVPLLDCVRRAERLIAEKAAPHPYLPIDGIAAYDKAVQALLLGADNPIVQEGRAVTVQALGGTGGLRVGADFLKRFAQGAKVWISDPSWENHRALFEAAGLEVGTYAYYDAATRGLDFAGMIASLERLPADSVVVLHACCHNPTGVDPTPEQWQRILDVVRGFAESVPADGAIVRRFAATPGPLFVASSFSKSFSLYGERVGALTIVTDDKDEAVRVLSQVKRIVRANYSNPPSYGGQIVTTVLTTPDLIELWDRELAGMRERIKSVRAELVQRVEAKLPGRDFKYVLRQRGMFSYSGLTKAQVARLRAEYSVYAIDSGRVCVAAVNSRNVGYVAEALAAVLA
jgi:aromatic-amino-acid transaminase